ncbi:hypothetical protein T265_07123 [Opisthorchis viverrini]|uniref:Uncharacterized protein n=1 Tax=Opisthorchis viverrini TaxID=6198 RepID=A0A074ZI26_OPIVI|nr:hypothetical protein T265_07123 [Opisthorchis viverrini]KER25442.1 hypothetical protein T265_07123 [Opisthorchis viverrini]
MPPCRSQLSAATVEKPMPQKTGRKSGRLRAHHQDNKGTAVNSTHKPQRLGWTRSILRRQVVKPTEESTTSIDLDSKECCMNPATTETVKLPVASSTPSKMAPSFMDTLVARNPDDQSPKPDIEPENPSYTQLGTLISGDPGVHTNKK